MFVFIGFQTSTVKAIYIFDLSAQGKHFLPVLMNFRLWSSILFKRNVLTSMLSIFPLYLTCNPNLYLCERICSFLLSKNEYLQKLVASDNEENNDEIHISDIPGGPVAFEICAKFNKK
ncbi:hypothetical protein ERO13_D09G038020v2 [Gossypium hirsutum]|nr:hypothetical protein ERO13_D09G038020v2 [Gossypium hirsutum]